MRISTMYALMIIASWGNAMDMKEMKWNTHKVYHFGRYEDYHGFHLCWKPHNERGDQGTIQLYEWYRASEQSPGKFVVLDLFNSEDPIMSSPGTDRLRKMESVSVDGNWRITIAPLRSGKDSIDGYQIITQCSDARILAQQRRFRSTFCTRMAAYVRSWCSKKRA